jgi:hypothetical protein
MFNFPTLLVRRKMLTLSDSLQLAVLRRVIQINRAASRARAWLEPVRGCWWWPPAAFVMGLVGGWLTR